MKILFLRLVVLSSLLVSMNSYADNVPKKLQCLSQNTFSKFLAPEMQAPPFSYRVELSFTGEDSLSCPNCGTVYFYEMKYLDTSSKRVIVVTTPWISNNDFYLARTDTPAGAAFFEKNCSPYVNDGADLHFIFNGLNQVGPSSCLSCDVIEE